MKYGIRTLSVCATALTLLLQANAMGQTKAKTSAHPAVGQPAAPAVPLPKLATAEEATAMIRIDAIIIELDQKLGVEIDVAVDEVKRVKQSKEAIAIITRNAQENLMRRLLDSGAGKVVSRPKIMTTSGRSATVEVGQEVLASSPGNTLVAPRQIGLRLHCRPVLTGQMLHMEVECENSKLNDQNAIEVQKLETAMELSSGETLMLSGVGNNRLMVFLTPQVLPLQFTQSDLAVNTEPIAATNASSRLSDMGRHVARIQEVFRVVDPDSLTSIDVDADEISVTAQIAHDAKTKIPQLLSQLAKIETLRIARISTETQGDRTQIEIRCDLGDAPLPASDDSLREIGTVMRKLFPEEKIEMIELPNSVVLRGTVSETAMPRIIRVAEDYFPSVISHLENSSRQDRPAADPINSDRVDMQIGEQLRELRGDVRALRDDVKKLIEMMEANRDDGAVSAKRVKGKTVSEPADATVADLETWELRLPEVMSIIEQNDRGNDAERLRQRVQMTRNSFARLRSLQLQNVALQAESSHQQALRDAGYAADAPPSSSRKRILAQQHELRQRILEEEQRLRSQMGLAATDGRLITPVD